MPSSIFLASKSSAHSKVVGGIDKAGERSSFAPNFSLFTLVLKNLFERVCSHIIIFPQIFPIASENG